jgi:Na+/proline symporter
MSLTFPPGIVGLVIASIMAASLSSVDSAIARARPLSSSTSTGA